MVGWKSSFKRTLPLQIKPKKPELAWVNATYAQTVSSEREWRKNLGLSDNLIDLHRSEAFPATFQLAHRPVCLSVAGLSWFDSV